MYEIYVNGKFFMRTENEELAYKTFDFYNNEKKVFKIKTITIVRTW